MDKLCDYDRNPQASQLGISCIRYR